MWMDKIPLTKRAALTAQMALKMEPSLDEEVRMLKAKGVDVPEMVRAYLRKEIPRIKKALAVL
jgi:hypothetical protein